MQKVRIKTEIDLRNLLAQLNTSQLEALLREISALIERRKATDQKAQEARLLQQLNEDCVLSDAHWQQFTQLVKKREAATISEAELSQLDQLTRGEEQLRLKRIQLLGELADLRGIPLPQLTQELGIHPPQHGVSALHLE